MSADDASLDQVHLNIQQPSTIDTLIGGVHGLMDKTTSGAENLVPIVIALMQKVGKMKDQTGHQKKMIVMQCARRLFTMEQGHAVDLMMSMLIDVLIDTEKGKLVINPKVKSCFQTMFKCCKKTC